jgi:hypothetical protein
MDKTSAKLFTLVEGRVRRFAPGPRGKDTKILRSKERPPDPGADVVDSVDHGTQQRPQLVQQALGVDWLLADPQTAPT